MLRLANATTLPETRMMNYAMSLSGPADDVDKENINPTTGNRAGPETNRKTLSAKSHVPLATKGRGGSSKANPTSKKPKALKRSTANKDRSTPKNGRKATKRSALEGFPLSKVEEERESEKEIERIILADIDSRCFELTVKPLADLSEAFSCASTFIGEGQATDEILVDKDYVFDLELCDYSTPAPPTPPTTPTNAFPRYTTSFSTPEQKLLFAAFTFSSPSPFSKRLKSIGNGSACTSPTP